MTLLAVVIVAISAAPTKLAPPIEQGFCMGLRVVSPVFLEKYTEITTDDPPYLLFNGDPAPWNPTFGKVILCVGSSLASNYYEASGIITPGDQECKLFFLKTDSLASLTDSAANNDDLCIIALKNGCYRKIKVSLTTLPVMELNGEFSHVDDSDRDVLSGEGRLWGDPLNTSMQSFFVEWHVRGASAAKEDKKPWKLTVKTARGKNADANFLGLGSDDDYILNPMNMDDSFLREKTAMDIWNGAAGETSPNMSKGEYVELIINGKYCGLYLLQRRVDRKYLSLDKDRDILIKGISTWKANTLRDAYEIDYSPYDTDMTYDILASLTDGFSLKVDPQSFIDTQLFLDALTACDNTGYKNMFYILRYTDVGYKISLLPWDTDMSFGMVWKAAFVHRPDIAYETTIQRMEYSTVKKYCPDLEERLSCRWEELRQTKYSDKNVLNIIRSNKALIDSSGAAARDNSVWGLKHGGTDTCSSLEEFFLARLAAMDERLLPKK